MPFMHCGAIPQTYAYRLHRIMIRLQKLTPSGWTNLAFDLEINEAVSLAKYLSQQNQFSYRLITDEMETLCLIRSDSLGASEKTLKGSLPTVAP